ncbi:MAG TPA: TolC family protein [Bacteroidales bacterium]|nr:TolC family protein [Bacteroidales bacterium]
MKIILRSAWALLFVALAGTLTAREPLVLTLDSAVNYAVRHNRMLINSRYSVNKMTQRVRESIATGLPQINATIDYTNYLGAEATLKLSEAAPPATISFNPTSNLKAGVSQLVFSGSYIVGLQIANLAKKLSEQSYQKDEADVKEQAIQAYYLILASERILGVLKENAVNARQIWEKTTNIAQAGMLEETDAKKLQIMVTTVENQVKSTERQVELGYNLLRLQLGLDPGQPVNLSSTLDDLANRFLFLAVPAPAFNVNENVNYKLVQMNEEIARKTIRLHQSSYLPTLAAFYSYNEKLKKPLFDMTPKHAVGLTLSIPIFSGGQRLAQVKQAGIDRDVAENSRKLLAQQLMIQDQQQRYTYQNLLDQFMNQKVNKEIAHEVLEQTERKYSQGVVSTLELTSANSDYLVTETTYTSLLLQLLNAELSIRKTNNQL